MLCLTTEQVILLVERYETLRICYNLTIILSAQAILRKGMPAFQGKNFNLWCPEEEF
jgi:hypothetical protein